LDNGQQALLFFYGVFWATVISSTSPYRAFATTLALSARNKDVRVKACKRLIVAFIILNVIPVVLLYILYKWQWIVPAQNTDAAIAAGAVASLSVFGINRVFHAFVCSRGTWNCFYTQQEISAYNLDNEEKSESPFWAHFIPGIFYLVGMPLIAALITCLSRE